MPCNDNAAMFYVPPHAAPVIWRLVDEQGQCEHVWLAAPGELPAERERILKHNPTSNMARPEHSL